MIIFINLNMLFAHFDIKLFCRMMKSILQYCPATGLARKKAILLPGKNAWFWSEKILYSLNWF